MDLEGRVQSQMMMLFQQELLFYSSQTQVPLSRSHILRTDREASLHGEVFFSSVGAGWNNSSRYVEIPNLFGAKFAHS